jgi:hypothetical protein
VLLYVAFFAVGSGPVTWVLLAEVLPPRIKGPAASLATAVAWAGGPGGRAGRTAATATATAWMSILTCHVAMPWAVSLNGRRRYVIVNGCEPLRDGTLWQMYTDTIGYRMAEHLAACIALLPTPTSTCRSAVYQQHPVQC